MYTKFSDTETVFFDVDDTLILYSVSKRPEDAIFITSRNTDISVIPNIKLVNRLIDLKKQGKVVVVWSAGGSDWAEIVVNKLNIQDYVDCILSKPSSYYDDLDSTEWMPSRQYET